MITELEINFEPYKWQVEGFRKFVDEDLNGFAMLADVGTGKTAEAITLLRHICSKTKLPKILIVGPSVVIHNWKNEIKKYCIGDELPEVYPMSDSKQRIPTMEKLVKLDASAVVITNYETFDNPILCKLIDKWSPDIMVLDEVHRIKSYKSKRAKEVIKIADFVPYRLALTGSAVLNTPMDIFQQWKFVDKGEAFGVNFFNFRSKYFYDANAKWAGKLNYFPKWEPIGAKYNEHREIIGAVEGSPFWQLGEKIKKNSIRVIKSECMDLPPYIEKTIKLEMSPKQKKAYDQMQKDFITFIEGETDKPKAVVAQLALTKALRLMQIASGFATTDTGEDHIFTDNPKLDAVQKIIEDNEQHKIIIWCSFKANYTAIGELLTKMKIKHVFITGQQNANEKQEIIEAFQEDKETRIVVANRKAGGIGVNLTAAALSIVFSRNFSLEEEIQSDGRNYRGGSQIHESITKINLVMEATIEEQAILALKNKSVMSEIILDMKHTAI